MHTRSFEVSADEITITDKITDGAGQLAQAVLLLHPDAQIAQSQDDRLEIIVGSVKVEVSASAAIIAQDASWHPDQGIDLPTKKLCINFGHSPCQGQFKLRKIS